MNISARQKAIELMQYVDQINMKYGGEGTKMYSTAGTHLKKLCLQNKLNLLDASVRHLGTDINYIVLENLYAEMKDKIDFYFDTPVTDVEVTESGFRVCCGAACAMNVTSVSFLSVEAEANGWRVSARSWRFPRSQTGWISACA